MQTNISLKGQTTLLSFVQTPSINLDDIACEDDLIYETNNLDSDECKFTKS